MVRGKSTDTTIFLVPALGISREELKQNGFINAYLKDESTEHESDHYLIYGLFKPQGNRKFNEFIEKLDEQGIVYTEYDYPDEHVVVVFLFPKLFDDDYKMILLGHYSKCSQAFKGLFPETRTQDGVEILNFPHAILNRTEAAKTLIEEEYGVNFDDLGPDAECWGLIDIDGRETLHIDQIVPV